jgi:hypothetical protein
VVQRQCASPAKRIRGVACGGVAAVRVSGEEVPRQRRWQGDAVRVSGEEVPRKRRWRGGGCARLRRGDSAAALVAGQRPFASPAKRFCGGAGGGATAMEGLPDRRPLIYP